MTTHSGQAVPRKRVSEPRERSHGLPQESWAAPERIRGSRCSPRHHTLEQRLVFEGGRDGGGQPGGRVPRAGVVRDVAGKASWGPRERSRKKECQAAELGFSL